LPNSPNLWSVVSSQWSVRAADVLIINIRTGNDGLLTTDYGPLTLWANEQMKNLK